MKFIGVFIIAISGLIAMIVDVHYEKELSSSLWYAWGTFSGMIGMLFILLGIRK